MRDLELQVILNAESLGVHGLRYQRSNVAQHGSFLAVVAWLRCLRSLCTDLKLQNQLFLHSCFAKEEALLFVDSVVALFAVALVDPKLCSVRENE